MKTGHIAVTSSQIASYAYDAGAQLLNIVFVKHGDEYQYSNVPQAVVDELVTADSFGSAFARLIRKHPEAYPFTKV
jgi:hypothetical protein